LYSRKEGLRMILGIIVIVLVFAVFINEAANGIFSEYAPTRDKICIILILILGILLGSLFIYDDYITPDEESSYDESSIYEYEW
jgi:UDP-N-acetylmuramyl pentapeptide phosphotransferase/UDP-N-acetylglucosamine-1-phosphate transferase